MTLIWLKFSSCYKHNVVYSKDWWLLKIQPDDEVKHFVALNFSEYFKSTGKSKIYKENLYSNLSEGQDLRIVAKSLYI